jgi:hypothetical protein
MPKFRVTLGGYKIEKIEDDGTVNPFVAQYETIFDGLDRKQMKFIESVLVAGVNALHEEGLNHPDA